jgi:hypothetical protein
MHNVRTRVVCLAGIILIATTALWAETKKEVNYSVKELYPAAIRYIRVDKEYEIVEKDADGGYIIFNCVVSGGKKLRASLELVARGGEGGADKGQRTAIVVKIAQAPSYIENEFIDGLVQKIEKEHRQ